MEKEVTKVIFIDEKVYQQIKEKMGKTSDYFYEKEFEKIGVI